MAMRTQQRRGAPAPARGRLPLRRRQPEPSRGEKLMRLVRGILPGTAKAGKRQGGRHPRRALVGVAGAGAAGMAAVAARRRKRGSASPTADTEPQPEPRTAPSPTGEAPRSEDAD
jgi:hypothetical protein